MDVKLLKYIKSVAKNKYTFHIMNHDWGNSIFLMHKRGVSFGRVYWYNDDETTVYLDFFISR